MTHNIILLFIYLLITALVALIPLTLPNSGENEDKLTLLAPLWPLFPLYAVYRVARLIRA